MTQPTRQRKPTRKTRKPSESIRKASESSESTLPEDLRGIPSLGDMIVAGEARQARLEALIERGVIALERLANAHGLTAQSNTSSFHGDPWAIHKAGCAACSAAGDRTRGMCRWGRLMYLYSEAQPRSSHTVTSPSGTCTCINGCKNPDCDKV